MHPIRKHIAIPTSGLRWYQHPNNPDIHIQASSYAEALRIFKMMKGEKI